MVIQLLASLLALTFSLAAPPEAELPKFRADSVVFLGSSSIDFWRERIEKDFPNSHPIDLGLWGTDLAYLQENIDAWTKKYPAKTFVIYSGENDINNEPRRKAFQVAADYRKLLDTIHEKLPSAKVLVLSIKPRVGKEHLWSHGETVKANELLRKELPKLDYVTFLDTYPRMFKPDQTPRDDFYREDGIHLNAKGYDLWRDIVRPHLPGSASKAGAEQKAAAEESGAAETPREVSGQ